MRRLARTQERHQRDLKLLSEAFAVFVHIWFAQAPQIPESEKSAAKRTAHSRYVQFVEFVGSQFAAGARLVGDVIKEEIAVAARAIFRRPQRGARARASSTRPSSPR